MVEALRLFCAPENKAVKRVIGSKQKLREKSFAKIVKAPHPAPAIVVGNRGRKSSYNIPLGINQEVVATTGIGRSSRPVGIYDRSRFTQPFALQVTLLSVKEELEFLQDQILLLMQLVDNDLDMALTWATMGPKL